MENLDEIHDILNDLTCNIEEYIKEDAPAVKEYTPRAKDESKTNFWTLYQRKYPNIRVNYYRRNAEKIKEKSKERYQNDPKTEPQPDTSLTDSNSTMYTVELYNLIPTGAAVEESSISYVERHKSIWTVPLQTGRQQQQSRWPNARPARIPLFRKFPLTSKAPRSASRPGEKCPLGGSLSSTTTHPITLLQHKGDHPTVPHDAR
eukprot:1195237-Prorocentrum_minimum.AAC.3